MPLTVVPQITLRTATVADAENLLRWRNDHDTRRWSRNASETSAIEHAKWLATSLSDAARRLWIAEIDGVAVGTVRTDRTDEGVELSWTVAPERRGQGVGSAMVCKAMESLPGRVYAYMKAGNEASVRIAITAGLRLEGMRQEFMCYSTVRDPAAVAEPIGGENVPRR